MPNGINVVRFEKSALGCLAQGWVTDIQFSNTTYVIEITDPKDEKKAWTFFQFDDSGNLSDAFCSCEKESCLHLAIAFLKIYGDNKEPLHIRFENSFWKKLTSLFAREVGFDAKLLKKRGESTFYFENSLSFSIKARSQSALKRLKKILFPKARETPDNSIKFSNLPSHEIERWEKGRHGFSLRFELSFWSELAKWLFLEDDAKASYDIKVLSTPLPTHLLISFSDLDIEFNISSEMLCQLIHSFSTIKTPFHVDMGGEKKLKRILYDRERVSFILEHEVNPLWKKPGNRIALNDWIYLEGVGFYRREERALFSGDVIEENEIDRTLSLYGHELAILLEGEEIHFDPHPLKYNLFFDSMMNLHIEGYLFEKGDLTQKGSQFFEHFAYLPDKGFFSLSNLAFETVETVVKKEDVGHFVSEHRSFFTKREGFNLHVSGLETSLSYKVTEHSLIFFPTQESAEVMDFGEYIYFQNLGFFSKKQSRLTAMLRPTLEVAQEKIAPFIREFREELENITGFFLKELPLKRRGLTIKPKGHGLQITPEVKFLPEYEKESVRLFGNLLYIENKGFYELASEMMLPERYEKEIFIKKEALDRFFKEELPLLRPYILEIDPRILPSKNFQLILSNLERDEGRFIAKLSIKTEVGSLDLLEIIHAHQKKVRFLFSNAGRIDLKEEPYSDFAKLKEVPNERGGLSLSTIDLLRLDIMFSLTLDKKISQETRALLNQLREFKPKEPPNLDGFLSQLRQYQKSGVDWLWFLYKNGLSGLLSDEMGLGKTHQAMGLLQAVYNENREAFFLIVAPTSVIYHWQEKLSTFLPKIPVTLYHGIERGREERPKGGILLTSYGILRMEKEFFHTQPFTLAIFDEIQIAKNPKSLIHTTLSEVQAPFRLGLTGTPIENNLKELKSLFDISLPNYLPSEARFKELFLIPIEKENDDTKKLLLKKLITPFLLRRKKREVISELPEKTEDKFYADLSDEQKALYSQALQDSESVMREFKEGRSKIPYLHVFALISRLKQISDHPALFLKDPRNYKKHQSGKWDLFVELLSEALDSEQKVVVFSQYLYMLDMITFYLEEQKIPFAQIRGDTVNREEEMRRFQTDDSCKVFVGSLQAAGLGIDLTAASTVILYDRWWNIARENQAIDRVHRIGQKWAVQVYKLIMKGTIEEKIDLIISRKAQLMEEIIPVDDEAEIKSLSRAQLIDLLRFDLEVN